MKPSFWITLFISVLVGIAVLMIQASWNKSLGNQLAEEQRAPTKSDERGVNTDLEDSHSQARIERAVSELQALVPEEYEIKKDPIANLTAFLEKDRQYKGAFLGVLRSVEGLSFDELVAVAEKTSDSKFQKWLFLLAAELDPVRFYREGKWKGRISAGQMAEALATKDPAAALRILPPMKPRPADEGTIYLSGESRLKIRIQVATKLLSSDLDLGLQSFLEIQENLNGANWGRIPLGDIGSLGFPVLPEGSVSGIIEVMGEPRYSQIRDDLIRLTTTNLLFEGGVESVIEEAESMQLTSKERQATIEQMNELGAMSSDPNLFMEWIADVEPDEVPSALVDWAELDLDGATTWLDQLSPSPVRDKAIAKFSREASKLDLPAAETWASQIQDEGLKMMTLRWLADR